MLLVSDWSLPPNLLADGDYRQTNDYPFIQALRRPKARASGMNA